MCQIQACRERWQHSHAFARTRHDDVERSEANRNHDTHVLNWAYFPKSSKAPPVALSVVEVFEKAHPEIASHVRNLESNDVLAVVASGLRDKGFLVESGKKVHQRISVPVLFGLNGRLEKAFDADAYHEAEGFVVEVEAGRAVDNNQFLKDLFQACMMHDVQYLAIAVRNVYRRGNNFELVRVFFETLYASNRLILPLRGILVIGY